MTFINITILIENPFNDKIDKISSKLSSYIYIVQNFTKRQYVTTKYFIAYSNRHLYLTENHARFSPEFDRPKFLFFFTCILVCLRGVSRVGGFMSCFYRNLINIPHYYSIEIRYPISSVLQQIPINMMWGNWMLLHYGWLLWLTWNQIRVNVNIYVI